MYIVVLSAVKYNLSDKIAVFNSDQLDDIYQMVEDKVWMLAEVFK